MNSFLKFANCIPVKGYNIGIIYDLQRGTKFVVPNRLIDFVFSINKKSVLEIENGISSINREYKDYMINNELGIDVDSDLINNFIDISLDWKHFAVITNAILEINKSTTQEQLTKSFLNLEGLGCFNIQVQINEQIDSDLLIDFFSLLNQHSINSIELVIKDCLTIEESIKDILEHPKLLYVVIYNSTKLKSNHKKIFYSSLKNLSRIEIDFMNFTVNIALFSESIHHNTYYNRKFFISGNGTIKNTAESELSFGKIQNYKDLEELKLIIGCSKFQEYWFINKDIIDVCKDCEFRHMCVDACLPVKRTNGSWYRSQECNYNPYICKWDDEEGYVHLEESGIVCNNYGYNRDEIKIAKINEKLWGI